MPKLLEEIITNYKMATGKEAKISSVPATPGTYQWQICHCKKGRESCALYY
jgi:hypothetical protein